MKDPVIYQILHLVFVEGRGFQKVWPEMKCLRDVRKEERDYVPQTDLRHLTDGPEVGKPFHLVLAMKPPLVLGT